MKKLTLVLAVVLTLLLLLSGCGPQPLPEEPTSIPTLAPATLPAATATEATAGGEPTSGTEATPGGSGDLVAAGQQVFEQNCSVCHNLTTETKVGPGLAGLFDLEQLPNGQPVNEDNLREWITTGGGGMPAIPLNDTDLTAVIAFLKDATQ
ncbi:MAG: cytochrome c [Anaerolineae bacterium]|jgi:mono/diheme cytochrome c family protein